MAQKVLVSEYLSMAAPSGEIPAYVENNVRHVPCTERRKRIRMQVHWPLRFLRPGTVDDLETITQDLTSDGFRCRTKVPLAAGDSSMCTLGVPAHDPKDASRTLLVECEIRVVWARAADEGFHHLGCRIENYRFLDTIPSGREPFRAG